MDIVSPFAGLLIQCTACFEYFRDRSELKASIEENKQILKDKMSEAQLLGERANQSRQVCMIGRSACVTHLLQKYYQLS
jgi:hypothetical protein